MHGSTDGPENRKESKLKIHSQSLDDKKEVRLNQAIPSSDNPEVKDIRNIMGKGEICWILVFPSIFCILS